jgi:hypothetical protein
MQTATTPAVPKLGAGSGSTTGIDASGATASPPPSRRARTVSSTAPGRSRAGIGRVPQNPLRKRRSA